MNAFNSTLPNRKKPLKAKKGFKPRSQSLQKHPVNAPQASVARFSAKKVSGQRKGLRKRSKKLQKRLTTEYYPASRKFLARPENEFCAICVALGEQQPRLATETHHKFGRSNSLLSDVRGFIPSCRFHRTWPHKNPKEARELGLLGSAVQWNVPIDRHLTSD